MTDTYEAWIIGEHDGCPWLWAPFVEDGMVVVHDIAHERWAVMTRASFDMHLEWEGDAPVE